MRALATLCDGAEMDAEAASVCFANALRAKKNSDIRNHRRDAFQKVRLAYTALTRVLELEDQP